MSDVFKKDFLQPIENTTLKKNKNSGGRTFSLGKQKFLHALGQRLRELRGTKTRADFAGEYLASPASLARWEAGEALPPLGFLIRLAAAFDCNAEWLATGQGEPRPRGRLTADKQLAWLDGLDWLEALQGVDAPPQEKTARPDPRLLAAMEKVVATQESLVAALERNAALREETERLRSRVARLEHDLGEALKSTDGPPPERASTARAG